MPRNIALNVNGLLWLEHDQSKPLSQIVEEACAAHVRRLGVKPNTVLVHPTCVPEDIVLDGIRVGPQHGVLLCHYHVVCLG